MTGSDETPPTQRNAGENDPLVDIVEEYIRLYEEGEAPDLAVYCERFPEALRNDVHEHCRRILDAMPLLANASTDAPGREEEPEPRFEGYRLVREVKRGGMGVVYSALEETTGRLFAIKVLREHLRAYESFRARFQREIEAARRLSHPSIVPIHDVGHQQDGDYFVMEFIEGETVGQAIAARRLLERDDPDAAADSADEWRKEATRITIEVGEALGYAHEEGVVHRDVKPNNILLDRERKAFLTDFGLARHVGDDTITVPGDLAGTPHYMSPEQALAQRVEIDHRTDVYSLGVVLYEMLTLRRPFEGDSSQEVLYAITFGEPEPPTRIRAEIPRKLETICLTAMEKNPAHRYQSAEDMVADLRRFEAGQSLIARRRLPIGRLGRAMRRRPRLTAAAALVIIAALVGLAYLLGRTEPEGKLSVTVQDGLEDAVVYVRRIDSDGEVGPTRRLGTAPVSGFELPPGSYRIAAVHPDAGFGEGTVSDLADGADATVDLFVRRDDVAREGMVRIEGGSYEAVLRVPDDAGVLADARRTVALRPFWIDRDCVTNDEYLNYVRTTGAPRPYFWPDEDTDAWRDRPDDFGRRPVTGVTPVQAAGYARWAGKRLPTAVEWERAMSGPEGHAYPWGAEADLVVDGRRLGPEDLAHVGQTPPPGLSDFDEYVRMTRVADWHPGAHLFTDRLRGGLGNVWECTSSAVVARDGDRIVAVPGQVQVRGGSWGTKAETIREEGLRIMLYSPRNAVDPHRGFRCARSDAP